MKIPTFSYFFDLSYHFQPCNYYHPHSEGIGKVLFSQVSVCPHLGGGVTHLADRGYPFLLDWGVPHPSQWGYPPSKVRMGGGVPQGTPSCPGQVPGQEDGGTPNQNSTVCTCYAVGGMPLAFTQEDFLVPLVVILSAVLMNDLYLQGTIL